MVVAIPDTNWLYLVIVMGRFDVIWRSCMHVSHLLFRVSDHASVYKPLGRRLQPLDTQGGTCICTNCLFSCFLSDGPIGVNFVIKVGAHGERWARGYNGGLGAEPPAGSRGRAPAESILPFTSANAAQICQFLSPCKLLKYAFWATVCKTVHSTLLDRCLSVCPVCDVGVLWPNDWMDQHATWYGGKPPPCAHCVRWGPSSPKGHNSPQFSTHVYCGQAAGWIKMPLGTEVGLGPGHIVLGGDPAAPTEKGTAAPNFSAHV